MDYWSRIDLHQHTNHDIDCTGRKVNDNYTHRDYFNWLKEQNVNLKAVTCHNNIDICEHVKQAIISDLLHINHLVGVEIDYKFDSLEFHAISILSPNVDVIKFSEKLSNMRQKKGYKVFFNKQDFCELHEDIEFIFIPHAIKDKGLLDHEIEASTIDWVIKALISGAGFPILFENTKDYYLYSMVEKIHKVLNKSEIGEITPAYVGSDYKFDNDDTRKKKILEKGVYSINALPTYRGLEISLRNSDTRLSLDSQIINRERYIKEIRIKNNKSLEESTINLSPGLNVIIGNSGSGKTLLLNQILFEIKKVGLSAAIKSSKEKGKTDSNPYEKKVGKSSVLDIKFDTEIDPNNIKIIEIPNIYSEILKSQDDELSIAEKFGINNENDANAIINQYKNDINNYYQCIKNIQNSTEAGEKALQNMCSAIEFLSKNKISSYAFNLNKEIFDESEFNVLETKYKKINEFINQHEKIVNYFNSIKDILTSVEDKNKVDDLISKYKDIVCILKKELIQVAKNLNYIVFEKRLTSVINEQIEESINKLGNKEKTVKSREEIYTREFGKFINELKETIVYEKEESDIHLLIPYDSLKKEIETNSNDYARLTLNDSLFNVDNTNLEDSKLFNLDKIKSKVKSLNLSHINLLNSDSTKDLIIKLNQVGINLSEIITDVSDLPRNIELYLDDKNGWKLISDINKGDIAKKSIEFYFNRLIKDQQPDIILIDQPENDVDKNFISETLSKFIKTQKIEKQIIVTSHDAIVAINSDANMIIEASINNNNKISYNSYCLEYVEEEKLVATNKVALILDGGKKNIKKRYQIYGGELTYEN